MYEYRTERNRISRGTFLYSVVMTPTAGYLIIYKVLRRSVSVFVRFSPHERTFITPEMNGAWCIVIVLCSRFIVDTLVYYLFCFFNGRDCSSRRPWNMAFGFERNWISPFNQISLHAVRRKCMKTTPAAWQGLTVSHPCHSAARLVLILFNEEWEELMAVTIHCVPWYAHLSGDVSKRVDFHNGSLVRKQFSTTKSHLGTMRIVFL